MIKRRGLEWPKQYKFPIALSEARRAEIAFFTLVYMWNRYHKNANIALDRLATLCGVNVNFIKAIVFKIQTSAPTNYEYTMYLFDIGIAIRKITHLPITRKDYYACLNKLTYHSKEIINLLSDPCLNENELKVAKDIIKTISGYVVLFDKLGDRVK